MAAPQRIAVCLLDHVPIRLMNIIITLVKIIIIMVAEWFTCILAVLGTKEIED